MAANTASHLQVIEKEIDKLRNEIETDSYNLDVKKGVLERLKKIASPDTIKDRVATEIENTGTLTLTVGPSDAIRSFMRDNPNKLLKPKDVADGLQQLVDNGNLKINSKNPPKHYVRSMLRTLSDQKGSFIERTSSELDDNNSVYIYRV